MSDRPERRRLARLTDAQFLTFVDEIRGELVVTAAGGYHLMLHPESGNVGPGPVLIAEVNTRRRRLFAYAQANTVRLVAIGVKLDPPDQDGTSPIV